MKGCAQIAREHWKPGTSAVPHSLSLVRPEKRAMNCWDCKSSTLGRTPYCSATNTTAHCASWRQELRDAIPKIVRTPSLEPLYFFEGNLLAMGQHLGSRTRLKTQLLKSFHAATRTNFSISTCSTPYFHRD